VDPAHVPAGKRVKPTLRGVFHELGFYAALGLGVPLVLTAHDVRARTAAAIFAVCVAACLGTSALYHRPNWKPSVRGWLARLDHVGVYLLIAASYVPFGLLVMSRGWAVTLLGLVWGGALAAILCRLVWPRAPKGLWAGIALGLGWVGAAALPQLTKVDLPGILLVVAGGLLYTAGAIVYLAKRPDPMPRVFGYHELFHLLTLGAIGCQYGSIAFFVLPRG
jgi:hemolysin III